MPRLLLVSYCLFICMAGFSTTIVVRNAAELNSAGKNAKPGDAIILQNGEWKDLIISLSCSGTPEQPIVFKAETRGSVVITGHSQLKLGGSFLVVDGWYFTNGYAGDNPVIDFKIDNNQPANHCRVTHCVIDDFNNAKRMQENYWVSFSGKNNRLDHCSFKNKKNMGVLLAVLLDDDRSRQNFHCIDHNYFGQRIPLASNSGEIIRIGVSQHAGFNSYTQITDNFFEHCDGEAEIISIKSGSNLVRGNFFKECQGAVVLRHGDNNTVENNIFLGNDKEGTGGVRVINKGQWVVNNYFYKCRGMYFRSPLTVMNGIPHSPAHRYVQVRDAVIANNTFYNCSPVSFCDGSDGERTLPPGNVFFANNIFFNDRDSSVYKVYDDISGFHFLGNEINKEIKQIVSAGFTKNSFSTRKNDIVPLLVSNSNHDTAIPDSVQSIAGKRLQQPLSGKAGFAGLDDLKKIQANAYHSAGAGWFKQLSNPKPLKPLFVNCTTTQELYRQVERKEPVIIRLTGKTYSLYKPLLISKQVWLTGNPKIPVQINTGVLESVFIVSGNGHLLLQNLNIDGKGIKATHFICSDSAAGSDHYNVAVRHCIIGGLARQNGCQNLFYASKYTVADSIVFYKNLFFNNNCNGLMMAGETDDKGYYNAEKILISHNNFSAQQGILLNVYRGGNDESTLGPQLLFAHNKIRNCSTGDNAALIQLTGVQWSTLYSNYFLNSNFFHTLIAYKDVVRSLHYFKKNRIVHSGKVEKNEFVSP